MDEVTKLNIDIAEKVFGLSWVSFELECSQFTPGARWINGGEYYAIDVYYAASQDIITEIQDDPDNDWSEYYLKNYAGDIIALYTERERCACVAESFTQAPMDYRGWSPGLAADDRARQIADAIRATRPRLTPPAAPAPRGDA